MPKAFQSYDTRTPQRLENYVFMVKIKDLDVKIMYISLTDFNISYNYCQPSCLISHLGSISTTKFITNLDEKNPYQEIIEFEETFKFKQFYKGVMSVSNSKTKKEIYIVSHIWLFPNSFKRGIQDKGHFYKPLGNHNPQGDSIVKFYNIFIKI
ncbi:hypothetical protein ACTFIR_011929 [Dictyostelium discoideum]